MNYIKENPKAVITALTGIVIFLIKTYWLGEKLTPEINEWLNIILPSIFLILIGRFTRITKAEAELLKDEKYNHAQ